MTNLSLALMTDIYYSGSGNSAHVKYDQISCKMQSTTYSIHMRIMASSSLPTNEFSI